MIAGAVAQLNIGLLHHPLDDPRTAGFTDNTARVNAVAERSEGYVWRCTNEAETLQADGIDLFDGDPCALATLSVWQSARDLDAFVHKTVHGGFLKRRAEWFRPLNLPTYVVWPVAPGHVPSFREGLERLDRLRAEGPSDMAFDFKYMRQKVQAE